jgi:hypothetical protein
MLGPTRVPAEEAFMSQRQLGRRSFVKLAAGAALAQPALSQAAAAPQWKAGSEFKARREAMIAYVKDIETWHLSS